MDDEKMVTAKITRMGGRIPEIDIVKGIAIILVVFGHTYPPCREYIYLFHMAVFLMASGYCWKDGGVNKYSVLPFWKKKIKKLYIPYIICNGVFVILTNVFIKFNIYTDNPAFISATVNSAYKQQLTYHMGVGMTLRALVKVVCGIGTTPLGSATWFIIELLVIVLVHDVIQLFINKFNNYRSSMIIYFILFSVLLVFSAIAPNTQLRGEIKRFPCTYLVFLLGLLIKKVEIRFKNIFDILYGYKGVIIAFCGLYVLQYYGNIEVSAARIVNPVFYILCSLLGWLLLRGCANILCHAMYLKKLRTVLIYIGQNTMPILCLHLLAFKLVSAAWVLLNHKPLYLIASFHIIFEASTFWCAIYTLVGVMVPLIIHYEYMKGKKLVFVYKNK